MDPNPQAEKVTIKPEEDARLPILEAQIETAWIKHRATYYRMLQKNGTLKKQLRETALRCVLVLHQYQEKGLNPDQGREAIQELIVPSGL
jgi:hypothetical protein